MPIVIRNFEQEFDALKQQVRDTWKKLEALDVDPEEIQQLREEVAELRAEVAELRSQLEEVG